MKRIRSAIDVATMVMLLAVAWNPERVEGGERLVVSLVDDFTGGKAVGFLDPESAVALAGLGELIGRGDVELMYYVVQERAEAPVRVEVGAWVGGELPEPPSTSLPGAVYRQRAAEYLALLQEVKARRELWGEEAQEKVERFGVEALGTRMAVEARWEAELAVRGGRDFRRSAVVAALEAAVAEAGAGVRHWILVHSDFEDMPEDGAGRVAPLRVEELGGARLVLVGTDEEMRGAELLAGLEVGAGDVVAGLAEAVALVVGEERED